MRKFRRFCFRFFAVVVGRLLLIPFFPVVATATVGLLAFLALLGVLTLDLIISGDWFESTPKQLRP